MYGAVVNITYISICTFKAWAHCLCTCVTFCSTILYSLTLWSFLFPKWNIHCAHTHTHTAYVYCVTPFTNTWRFYHVLYHLMSPLSLSFIVCHSCVTSTIIDIVLPWTSPSSLPGQLHPSLSLQPPPRPNFGQVGRPIGLRANHFQVLCLLFSLSLSLHLLYPVPPFIFLFLIPFLSRFTFMSIIFILRLRFQLVLFIITMLLSTLTSVLVELTVR